MREESARLDRIYRDFAATVHGIALARVGPDDADDVMQEVFVAVQTRLDELRDGRALAGWITAIARNTAVDWIRRRALRAGSPAELDAMPAPHASQGELGHRVLALVGTLPEAYRETLVLRLVEGMTGPEIAERTGMTTGSVRVNLHRGMSMLRPLLEKEGWP